MSYTIDWSRVKPLLQLYNQHPDRIETLVDDKRKTVHGWRVPKEVIMELLNQHDQNIEELFIMPMVKEEDKDKPQVEQYFTFVITGINENDEIVTNLAYDFHSECPRRCPSNLASITLP